MKLNKEGQEVFFLCHEIMILKHYLTTFIQSSGGRSNHEAVGGGSEEVQVRPGGVLCSKELDSVAVNSTRSFCPQPVPEVGFHLDKLYPPTRAL